MIRPDVLVLGGGGTLGEAWLRALLAGLEAETGWDLRVCEAFVGTSAGAIVAAYLASGRRPEAARGAAESWERAAARAAPTRSAAAPAPESPLGDVRRAALAVAAPLAPVVAAGAEPAGAALRAAVLRRGRRATREIPQLRRAIEALGGDFDGRLRVAAVDLRSGRRVVFGAPGAPAASVTEAVLASCAVPWVFRPVTIGGREYVDGGAWSAANLDAAPVREGTEVLCLNPTASPRLAADRIGAVRAFARAGAATEALILRRRGARVRIVAPDAAAVDAIGPNLFDARLRAAVEAAGYRQGRALASRT
ncbi:MAG TPA: patatin-like phospholipase family protein [Solirubrobacteraceae bacterium]|nr:patatin-like phospholipase family protein [Solirubrobacteraceae bacterium]